jgi:hypothetical protein
VFLENKTVCGNFGLGSLTRILSAQDRTKKKPQAELKEKNMKNCSRCLLNDQVPGVEIAEDGICSVCQKHDHNWADWEKIKNDKISALEKMFKDCRRKKRFYDVLVPLSGGKDSTYVLYLCKKKFGLRCLAVTFDNGFLSDLARENIKNTVEILGVDHIFYRPDWSLLRDLYRVFFIKTGFFCPVCMRGINVATEMAAEAFNISLIINGTCLRSEEYVAPEYFIDGSIGFFKAVLKGEAIEKSTKPFFLRPRWKRRMGYRFFWMTKSDKLLFSAPINLPDYLDWDHYEIYRIITSELKWRSYREKQEHLDCKMSDLVGYFRSRKFPVLIPELLRYSKLVSAGMMSKEEALLQVEKVQAEFNVENVLKLFLEKFDISIDELNVILSDPFRHMKYVQQGSSVVWKTLRSVYYCFLNAYLKFIRKCKFTIIGKK